MNIKKRFKFNSINVKTLGYLVVFSIIVLLAFGIFQTVFVNVFYERYQLSKMGEISQKIYNTSVEDLNGVLENLVYNNDICIEYMTSTGEVYGYNTMSFGCLLGRSNSNINEYKKSLLVSEDDLKAIRLTNPDYKSDALLYGIRQSEGYVFVFAMLEDINGATSVMRGQLIYIMLLAVIFAIMIAFFMSKRLTKPIEEITGKAKRLADGDYDVVFERNGIAEIDDLADTLNYLEKEISKTDEFRRDLMANVSHDLKTPLTMIKAYSEMIRDISYKSKKKREEHLDIIISETDRLNVLVNDILTLSKLQANAEVLNLEEFDLDREVENIMKRYQIIKETENYHIEYVGVKKAFVLADRNKINQVVYNLVNNAINYTGEDNMVNVRVSDVGSAYRVEVEDHGKGIEPEDIEHIWDKYYKKEKNHKRNVVGTGLGLSIVKNILSIHGFKYGVSSVRKKGTVFYFEVDKAKRDNE